MKSLLLASVLAVSCAAAIGCTSSQAVNSSRAAGATQSVTITPDIKAEIRRQGQDPDEEICKREDQMGSTIPRNVCATRAEWAAKTQASQDGTRDIQNNALRTRAPGS